MKPPTAFRPALALISALSSGAAAMSGTVAGPLVSGTAAALVSGTAAAVVLLPAPARACSVCGCGDPLLSASDPAAVNGRARFALETEALRVTSGAPADELHQYTARLHAVVSPWAGLSFIGQLPLTRKDLREAGAATSALSGLGDAEVGARVALVDAVNLARQQRSSLAASAGTSIPTGRRVSAQDGEGIDEHGQLGTGAWGPYAGLHYRFDTGRWSLLASGSGRLRTANAEGYRYGHALLWSAHAQVAPASRVALDLGLDGRHAAADRHAGAAVEDTGGTVIAVAPGAFLRVAGPVWLAARAQLPVATRLFGVQTVGPTLVAGLQVQVD